MWVEWEKEKRHDSLKWLPCLKEARYIFRVTKKATPLEINLLRQSIFRPALPVILNNVDYQRRESELKRMDELLALSGIEEQFVQIHHQQWLGERDPQTIHGGMILKQQQRSRVALRCMILVSWLGMDYRNMSIRLGESELYRWFCRLDCLGELRVPSKSEIGRFMQMGEVELLRTLNERIIQMAALPAGEQEPQALQLKNQIELETVWLDSTALKADIHFPVDWVLLRDATRTLMRATQLIRNHGLKHRMAGPQVFIRRMNKQCIAMSSARRKAGGKKQRKQVFRQMKAILKTVQQHATRHRDQLEQNWQQTDWSEKQAKQVIARIDHVLHQLPEVLNQAHARIIRGEKIISAKKILSLYEADVNVIVRGKPEAEIEFGNTLHLAEQTDGLIVDWQLHRKSAPNDSKQIRPSVERIEQAFGPGTLRSVVGDRQFDSQPNRQWLEEKNIDNHLCPRSVKELETRIQSATFQKAQRRRAQTEARIAILKNDFLGTPLRRRGFANREKQVAWSVLAHNLWLLARLEQAQEEPVDLPLAA